jgi:hypothetical protein
MSGEAPADKRTPTQPRFLRRLRRVTGRSAGLRLICGTAERVGQ